MVQTSDDPQRRTVNSPRLPLSPRPGRPAKHRLPLGAGFRCVSSGSGASTHADPRPPRTRCTQKTARCAHASALRFSPLRVPRRACVVRTAIPCSPRTGHGPRRGPRLRQRSCPKSLLLQKHLRASSWALFISRTHLRVGEASPGERAGSKGTDTCGLDRAQCARPQDCTNLNFLQNFRVKFCFSTALSTIEYITNLYLIRS